MLQTIAILAAIHLEDPDFASQEVVFDGISWMSTVMILELSFFMLNLYLYRGKVSSERSSGVTSSNRTPSILPASSASRPLTLDVYSAPNVNARETTTLCIQAQAGSTDLDRLQVKDNESEEKDLHAMGTQGNPVWFAL